MLTNICLQVNNTDHVEAEPNISEEEYTSTDIAVADIPLMPLHNILYIEAYNTYICGQGHNHPITVSLTRFTYSACGGSMGKKSV